MSRPQVKRGGATAEYEQTGPSDDEVVPGVDQRETRVSARSAAATATGSSTAARVPPSGRIITRNRPFIASTD